jgi:hypothetical protein
MPGIVPANAVLTFDVEMISVEEDWSGGVADA